MTEDKKRRPQDAVVRDVKRLRAEVRAHYRETHRRLKTIEKLLGIRFKEAR